MVQTWKPLPSPALSTVNTFRSLCSKLRLSDLRLLKCWSLSLNITSPSNGTFFITLQLKILALTAYCSHMSPLSTLYYLQSANLTPALAACRRPLASYLAYHGTAPFSPCNICLSPEMKRKCLPAGLQVAHHEGGQRLIPVIQLCWFTPHIHTRVQDCV